MSIVKKQAIEYLIHWRNDDATVAWTVWITEDDDLEDDVRVWGTVDAFGPAGVRETAEREAEAKRQVGIVMANIVMGKQNLKEGI